MAIAVAEEQATTGTPPTTSASKTVTCSAGDIIHVFFQHDGTGALSPSCSGSLNGSFGATVDYQATTFNRIGQFSKVNSAAGSETVTVTVTGGGSVVIWVLRISGGSTAAINAHASFDGTIFTTAADALSTGNMTPSSQPCLLVALAFSNDFSGSEPAPTAGTGFTSTLAAWDYGLGTNFGRTENKRLTSTSAVGGTFTVPVSSHGYHAVGAIYLEAAAAATTVGPTEKVPISLSWADDDPPRPSRHNFVSAQTAFVPSVAQRQTVQVRSWYEDDWQAQPRAARTPPALAQNTFARPCQTVMSWYQDDDPQRSRVPNFATAIAPASPFRRQSLPWVAEDEPTTMPARRFATATPPPASPFAPGATRASVLAWYADEASTPVLRHATTPQVAAQVTRWTPPTSVRSWYEDEAYNQPRHVATPAVAATAFPGKWSSPASVRAWIEEDAAPQPRHATAPQVVGMFAGVRPSLAPILAHWFEHDPMPRQQRHVTPPVAPVVAFVGRRGDLRPVFAWYDTDEHVHHRGRRPTTPRATSVFGPENIFLGVTF